MTTSRLRRLSRTPVTVHTICFALLGGALLLTAQPKKEGDPSGPENFTKDVAVPMRGGGVLRADVWLPAASGKFPVLVYRTAYGNIWRREDYVSEGHRTRVRGGDLRCARALRFDGEFWPYQYEGRDGHDTIEWAGQQAWSNGGVGTLDCRIPVQRRSPCP
jgi:predicted acyl esterase